MAARMWQGVRLRDASSAWLLRIIVAACFSASSCTPLRNEAPLVPDAGSDEAGLADVCVEDADCPPSVPCTSVRCRRGACVVLSTREGVALDPELQIEGDCRKLVCDGRGQTRLEDDDTDTGGDRNPCRVVRCENGVSEISDAPDDTACNGDGTCRSGSCSTCSEGNDCSRPSDCIVHRSTCSDGRFACEPTSEPRAGRACAVGKVCHDGSCVPCVVGAECDTGTPCYFGRIVSCEDELVCEPQPQSGTACGSDATGRTMYCVAGVCRTPCREGPCMSASGPCQTSHWECSSSEAAPRCVSAAVADGESCDDGSVCHAGSCARRSLVNGDFGRGLSGWELVGDAASFVVMADPGNNDRLSLSTSPTAAGSGSSARGSISQSFTVQADVTAVRFHVSGGHASVRLKDGSGAILHECTGGGSNDERIPVSWDLTARRGQRLTLAVEDELDSGDWGYVSVSGFDVVRDQPGPLRNAQWEQGFDAWETTGDGLHFNVFEDYNHFPTEAYGYRLSVSTYARDTAAASLASASRGSVSQMFVVPNDAVALRFNLHGGTRARVRLLEESSELHSVSARNSDRVKVPVSFNLEALRGKTLRLVIEDEDVSEPFGYIGTTGFDLITAYNGP